MPVPRSTCMNIIRPANYDRIHHAFLLNAELRPPLILLNKTLRSEEEYDNDLNAGGAALKFIHTFSKCFLGNVYVAISGQQIVKSNSFQARKGVLPPQSCLRKLELREIPVTNEFSRLGVVVSLAGFDYSKEDQMLLNFGYSMLILSRQSLDDIYPVVRHWLANESNSLLGFNYDAVVNDLLKFGDTAVMRYFPADNGRHEMLVVIGNEHFLNAEIQACLESAAEL
jgi:hypothetical protein